MRPPILFLTIAFGAGLNAGLDLFAVRGAWYVVVPVLGTALLLARRAPLGAALGVMGVAGLVWGMAAGREREATCVGRWSGERGAVGQPSLASRTRLPRAAGSWMPRCSPGRAAVRCDCVGPRVGSPGA